MTLETIFKYDPAHVKVSKAVANVFSDLEESGFDDRTWFRARFICPDLCAQIWDLFDGIDRAYSEWRPVLSEESSWEAFGVEFIMPLHAKCLEIVRTINGPAKR